MISQVWIGWGVALCLGACAGPLPYQPMPVRHAELSGAAFQRIGTLLQERLGKLVLADEATFRLRTCWVDFDNGEHPGRRRATVFRDPRGRLQVVVEVRYLRLESVGGAGWSPVTGDPVFEAALADEIAVVLAD